MKLKTIGSMILAIILLCSMFNEKCCQKGRNGDDGIQN